MTVTLLSHLLLAAALVFAVIYGGFTSFKKRGVAYMQIVTLAAGSMLLGEIFTLVMLLCHGEVDTRFNISMFGTAGCFFFTWSLAFGQIDSLGDDRSRAFRKYRLIALLQPTLFIVMFVIDLFSGIDLGKRMLNAFMLLPMAMTSYYALKHLILPDVEFGIFNTMRKYNICLLFIALLGGICLVLSDYGMQTTADLVRMVLAVDAAIAVPIAAKGVKQWFN